MALLVAMLLVTGGLGYACFSIVHPALTGSAKLSWRDADLDALTLTPFFLLINLVSGLSLDLGIVTWPFPILHLRLALIGAGLATSIGFIGWTDFLTRLSPTWVNDWPISRYGLYGLLVGGICLIVGLSWSALTLLAGAVIPIGILGGIVAPQLLRGIRNRIGW